MYIYIHIYDPYSLFGLLNNISVVEFAVISLLVSPRVPIKTKYSLFVNKENDIGNDNSKCIYNIYIYIYMDVLVFIPISCSYIKNHMQCISPYIYICQYLYSYIYTHILTLHIYINMYHIYIYIHIYMWYICVHI